MFQDGRSIGRANANAAEHTPSQENVDAFFARDTDGFHVKVKSRSFKVTGLRANTTYEFTVRAVLADGTLSEASNAIRKTTAKRAQRLVVTQPQFVAVGDGITLNTKAIQKAIDTCNSPNCTVVIPEGTFRTGALFLKSNMTLELAEGSRLLGSENWQDYPVERGYYLYPVPDPQPMDATYTQYLCPPSLLNVVPADNGRVEHTRAPGAVAQNVRIVGKGVVDGNGWKRTAQGSIIDEVGNELPDYIAGNRNVVAQAGILAASQVAHARETIDTMPGIVNRPETITDSSIYSQYRSSLATFIGVKGFYLEGFVSDNPAFHGIMFLDSEDIGVDATSHTTFNTNNGDGLEFGGSANAVVANNFFDTGDDVINFAAGQGKYGALGRSSHDVWMFGNYLRRGHGGVAIGSHTAAWVHDLLAEDNVMYRTETGALRMKSTSDMSGGVRNILFRDTAVDCMATNAFIASLAYTLSPSGYVSGNSATFRDIFVTNVSVNSNNSSTCGMPTRDNHPIILVEAGPGKDADTVGPFFYTDVRFRNVSPTSIQGLTGSVFKNVCFESVRGDQNPGRVPDPALTWVNEGGTQWAWASASHP